MKFKENQIAAALCRESYRHFFLEFWDTVVPEKLQWNWHLDLLCDELQELAEGVFAGRERDHDTIFNICPGSSKSMASSVMYLPWIWSRMPSARFIGASYAHSLALDLSRKSRDIIKSEKYKAYFPEVVLRKDQDAKGYFVNTRGGMRFAVGSGGSVIGMHGHFIMIDDPIDPIASLSEAELETINKWLQETLPSRKVDRRIAVMCLIMQRLSQGDPTDLFAQRDNVRHFIIPAEDRFPVSPEYLLEYYKDGLMDPIRLPYKVLRQTEKELGKYGYAGQYGQTPVPIGGGTFDTDLIEIVSELPPRMIKKVRFWDKAGLKGKGDYTAGVKMGKDREGRIWILNVERGQWNTFRREHLIKRTAQMDGFGTIVGLEQEGASGGLESVQRTVANLAGYRTRKIMGQSKKWESGTDIFSEQVNAGNVCMLKAGWNKAYIEELKYHPNVINDDQIKASAGAFLLLTRGRIRAGGLRAKNK